MTAAALVSASALAQPSTAPVQYFVNVQPITVCSTDRGCAAVNEEQANPDLTGPTAGPQIGFADSNNVDITRAILNQAGIDVSLLPLQPYRTNTTSDMPLNTLNLMMGVNPGQLSSMDLQTLTFQKQISLGVAPNPNPAGVPLSSVSHTLNLAFVTSLNPVDVAGVYYGLSWIKENGISVDRATFGLRLDSGNSGIFGAVPDALAHEIVHNLGLDHPTDNMNMLPNNLMTAMRDVPMIDAAVSSLGAGTTDQLNAQQIHDIIDPAHAGATGAPTLTNPFLNPIPNIDTRINNGTSPADFSVSFQAGGRPGESLQALALTAPAGFLFEFDTYSQLNLPTDTAGIIANDTFSNCTSFGNDQEACKSLILEFTGTTSLVLNGQFDYTVDVCRPSSSSCVSVPLADLVNDLTGGIYTYTFSDGYQTSSILQPLGDPILDANSWHPDLTIPTSLDFALFTPFFTGLPCVMEAGMTTCPELDLHADRYDQLIFESVPEPHSATVLGAGFVLWLVLEMRRRRYGRIMPGIRI
jgi:hypothetical protein